MAELMPRPVRVVPGAGARPVAEPRVELDLRPGPQPLGVPPVPGADESYRITVDESGVGISAHGECGVFRARTALAQLAHGARELPHQVIEDHPRFAWRGLMLDVARHFVAPDDVRRVIDMCALYHLNVLRLHLTENDAWRLEIPGRPELTSAPATVDGYYSVADFAQLQQYAAERFVTIVPEVDLPGHCGALRRAYPDLAGASSLPFTPPIDVTDPETAKLVQELLDAVAAQTVGSFLHVGCDEAFGMDADRFADAARRLREMVRHTGKQPITWQEAARGGVGPDDIVQYWTTLEMTELPATETEFAERPELATLGWQGVQAMRKFFAAADHDVDLILQGGGQVLLSPLSHLYLDRGYSLDVTAPEQRADVTRVGFPNYRRYDLQTAADWDPAACGVPLDAVAGVEATLFGESLRSFADITLLALPRLAVIAEAAWSPSVASWADLSARLATHAPIWRERGWSFFASTEVPWQ